MSPTSNPNDGMFGTPATRRKLALALVVIAAVVIAALVTKLTRGERWQNVVPSTGSFTPVFFSDTSLVRMATDGSAERASETARTRLPLEGAPRMFARGPANTIAFQSQDTPFVFLSLANDANSASGASGAANAMLTPQATLPAVKHVVTGELTRDRGTALLIVSTSGVATLWSTRGTTLDQGPQLVKSLMNMKVSRFSEGNEHLYVSYLDGGIDRFELASGTPTLALPARGMVKAIGAAAGSVVVADDKGVRWFDGSSDTKSTKALANLILPNVVAVEYGHLPKDAHSSTPSSAQGWLALTTSLPTGAPSGAPEHMLHVISAEQGGRDVWRSPIPLPSGETPVAVTTTSNEILVATDKGGVWQLRIQ